MNCGLPSSTILSKSPCDCCYVFMHKHWHHPHCQLPLLRKTFLQTLYISLIRQWSPYPSFHPTTSSLLFSSPFLFPSRSFQIFHWPLERLPTLSPALYCALLGERLGSGSEMGLLSCLQWRLQGKIWWPHCIGLIPQILAVIHTPSPYSPLSILSNKCLCLINGAFIVRIPIVRGPPPRN